MLIIIIIRAEISRRRRRFWSSFLSGSLSSFNQFRDPKPASDPIRNVRIRSSHLQHPRRLPRGHRPRPPRRPPHHSRLQQPLPMRNPRRHQDAPLRHRVRSLPPKRCVFSIRYHHSQFIIIIIHCYELIIDNFC